MNELDPSRTNDPGTMARPTLPLLVWTSPSGQTGYEISRVAPRVILASPWGSASLEEIEIYYRALSRLIDQSTEKALIVVLDYGRVANLGPEARRIFARTLGSLRTPLGGIVFVSLSPIQRVFVGLGRRMGSYPWPVRICHSRDEGLKTARQLALHGGDTESALPRRGRGLPGANILQRLFLEPQATHLKSALADFPWDSQSPVGNPYPYEHPFHDVFEMWRTIKSDLDQLDLENRQKQKAIETASRSHADAEQCLKAVLRACGSAIIVYDSERRIRMANPAAARLLGGEQRQAAIEGRDWSEFVHPTDRQRVADYHRRRMLDSTIPGRYECRLVDVEGREKIVAVDVEAVVGTALRAASLVDLTLQRRLEIDRFRLDGEMERLAAKVARLERELEDMATRNGAVAEPVLEDGEDGPMRVLVVEDDAALGEVVVDYLEAVGCEASRVSGGSAALELVDRRPFDVALVDLQIEEMDGLELVRRLRAHARFGDRPVVVMTGQAFDDDIERADAAGVDHHLVKPFLMEELVQTLSSLHEKRRKAG